MHVHDHGAAAQLAEILHEPRVEFLVPLLPGMACMRPGSRCALLSDSANAAPAEQIAVKQAAISARNFICNAATAIAVLSETGAVNSWNCDVTKIQPGRKRACRRVWPYPARLRNTGSPSFLL